MRRTGLAEPPVAPAEPAAPADAPPAPPMSQPIKKLSCRMPQRQRISHLPRFSVSPREKECIA